MMRDNEMSDEVTPCSFDWPSGADLVTGPLIGVLRLQRDVCVSVCVIFAAPRTSDGFITQSFVCWGDISSEEQ